MENQGPMRNQNLTMGSGKLSFISFLIFLFVDNLFKVKLGM